MAPSPFRSRLYRRLGQAVIWGALALIAAQHSSSQVARKVKPKGPRATGLIELASNGKAHLIPITIMVDGKFYDASAYKADPVPFALESEVVYQAMRTGVPQGEFTVTGALQAQDTWFGEGKWVAGGAKAKKTHVAEAKPNLDDDSGPPTLRKAGSKPSKTPEPAPTPSPAPAPAPTPSDTAHKPDNSSAETAPAQPAKPDAEDSSETANDQDPNRPSLRRGKQPPPPSSSPSSGRSAASTPPIPSAAQTSSKPKEPAKPTGPVQLIPAVSDAGGPEPRPYIFDMKPDEEQSYRKKLLALASAEVVSKAKQMTPVMPSAGPVKKTPAKAATKPVQPVLDNVQIRAFDLSNTNEPVFVLTAQAHMPASAAASAETVSSIYFVTLVAKADIYLDLHKLLAAVTDEHHLDEFPKFELIDAVDADGDGRGELLFREVSDAGSAWAVYRAAADQLYPLFEGKPQQPHPLPVSER
jgi:hypothetical protein